MRSMTLAATPVDRRAASFARLLVFRGGNERYGIALSCVREVAKLPRVAALPVTQPAIMGIINWRGEFVTALDTQVLLGLVPAADSLKRYVIVLCNDKPRIALAVDNLEGLAPFDPSQLLTVDRSSAKTTSLVKGIIADSVLVLDEEHLRICVEDLCTAQ
jgi:purine-binding chemotaxis protein CheW